MIAIFLYRTPLFTSIVFLDRRIKHYCFASLFARGCHTLGIDFCFATNNDNTAQLGILLELCSVDWLLGSKQQPPRNHVAMAATDCTMSRSSEFDVINLSLMRLRQLRLSSSVLQVKVTSRSRHLCCIIGRRRPPF